jgi:hypothetical protein
MKPRTHFRHTIDHLDALGEIIETIAGVDDFEIAETTWLAAVTIGIVVVAACAARPDGSPPVAAITTTCRATSSAAIAGNRSYWINSKFPMALAEMRDM